MYSNSNPWCSYLSIQLTNYGLKKKHYFSFDCILIAVFGLILNVFNIVMSWSYRWIIPTTLLAFIRAFLLSSQPFRKTRLLNEIAWFKLQWDLLNRFQWNLAAFFNFNQNLTFSSASLSNGDSPPRWILFNFIHGPIYIDLLIHRLCEFYGVYLSSWYLIKSQGRLFFRLNKPCHAL